MKRSPVPPAPASAEPDADETGLPWLHTWKGVYLLVIVHFAVWIALLVALTHLFS